MGDKLLLKLNICEKPIANKYCEGKMKRTLKRGLKDLKSLKRKRMERNIGCAWAKGSFAASRQIEVALQESDSGKFPAIKAVGPPEGAMLNLPKKLHLTRLETRTKESNT